MDIQTEIELEIRLREDLEKLSAEFESGKEFEKPPESLDGTIGRLSRQDSLLHQEIAKESQRQKSNRLRQIQDALKRIDLGTYGLCIQCDEPIAESRLIAMPETPFCSACA